MFTANFLRAIRSLPEKFIDDQTDLVEASHGIVFAANPKYAPIMFSASGWTDVLVSPLEPE